MFASGVEAPLNLSVMEPLWEYVVLLLIAAVPGPLAAGLFNLINHSSYGTQVPQFRL